jgi:integrase
VRPAAGIPAEREQELAVGGVAASGPARVGPVDGLAADDIVALLPLLPTWHRPRTRDDQARRRGARAILDWLLAFPGDGWQQRWVTSGADRDMSWLDSVIIDGPRTPMARRGILTGGLNGLLLCRVVLPSYEFLNAYRAQLLYRHARRVFDPELFARLEQAGRDSAMRPAHVAAGLTAIAKMVLHTGRSAAGLTAADVRLFRAWGLQARTGVKSQPPSGVHAAWDMLRTAGIITGEKHLVEDVRRGQRSAAELVDHYQIRCGHMRDVLVRYLNERRPGLDYGTFRSLAACLAGRFWGDIERHHPGASSLNLPADVIEAWKRRLSVISAPGKEDRPRSDYIEHLLTVRAFYLDIAQWALEDPSWVPWAVPCPIRRSETVGIYKKRQKVVARMHQRVRERLPLLPALVDEAHRHLADQTALLTRATATAVGDSFEHASQVYKRVARKTAPGDHGRDPAPSVRAENLTTGRQVDISRAEDQAFWAWAIIETLRHTGVRGEELLEITQLALVSYRLADTGEVVPLLQIVPSKSDEERLLLVSPELASVLATIISRLRAANDGVVPLVARYDRYERVTGPPLPHLFQRKNGWRNELIDRGTVQNLLEDTLARADLRDSAGQPLHFTPHDFRRMFATEAVTGGLPVHITARLLGHHNLTTTQAYLAVFQDDLIRSYRAFLDQRRAVRPQAEYREPTDEEWREFQQHFELRKLELGTCGRPYGSPCRHEHACIRCPMLRVDPHQRPRLVEIARNLTDRVAEARLNGWLGEVQGLQISLDAAHAKLVRLDRALTHANDTNIVQLGLPMLRSDP